MAKGNIEQTKIDAPYELPEGWKWCRLGDCATYINGRAFKPEEWETEGKPIIRIQNLTNTSDSVNRTTQVFEDKYLIKDNDLLYAWSASLGAHIWHGEDGWLNQHIFKVVPNEDVSKSYLYYSLIKVTDNLYAKAHGSGMVHVTLKPFLNTEISFPPTLTEQKRIVSRIETLFAKLDEAEEKTRGVLDAFETRKAAILHKAFTGELTANWRKANGVADDSWEEKTVDDICLVKGGKRVPKGMSLVKEKNEHPYLKAGNLKFGTVIDKDMEYVPEDVLKIIKNYTVSAGDVYITNVGACIGDCGIIPDCFDGANLTENAVKLTDLKCYNSYLAKLLASNLVQEQIKIKIKSATLGKLSIDNIKQLVINLPPLPEQQELVRILDSLLDKESRAKEAAQTVLDQIALLKKSILARAFRGEL